MKKLDPTYLRFIHEGLQKGNVKPENEYSLPEGLVGIYEEAFNSSIPVLIRQKNLKRFLLFSLLNKEVSVHFIAGILNESDEDILNFIRNYSKWFNSSESGKYQLYHERLKVYFLQKFSGCEIIELHKNLIAHLEIAIADKKNDEFGLYALEFIGGHLSIEVIGGDSECYKKFINFSTDMQFYKMQFLACKNYKWTENFILKGLELSLKNKDEKIIEQFIFQLANINDYDNIKFEQILINLSNEITKDILEDVFLLGKKVYSSENYYILLLATIYSLINNKVNSKTYIIDVLNEIDLLPKTVKDWGRKVDPKIISIINKGIESCNLNHNKNWFNTSNDVNQVNLLFTNSLDLLPKRSIKFHKVDDYLNYNWKSDNGEIITNGDDLERLIEMFFTISELKQQNKVINESLVTEIIDDIIYNSQILGLKETQIDDLNFFINCIYLVIYDNKQVWYKSLFKLGVIDKKHTNTHVILDYVQIIRKIYELGFTEESHQMAKCFSNRNNIEFLLLDFENSWKSSLNNLLDLEKVCLSKNILIDSILNRYNSEIVNNVESIIQLELNTKSKKIKEDYIIKNEIYFQTKERVILTSNYTFSTDVSKKLGELASEACNSGYYTISGNIYLEALGLILDSDRYAARSLIRILRSVDYEKFNGLKELVLIKFTEIVRLSNNNEIKLNNILEILEYDYLFFELFSDEILNLYSYFHQNNKIDSNHHYLSLFISLLRYNRKNEILNWLKLITSDKIKEIVCEIDREMNFQSDEKEILIVSISSFLDISKIEDKIKLETYSVLLKISDLNNKKIFLQKCIYFIKKNNNIGYWTGKHIVEGLLSIDQNQTTEQIDSGLQITHEFVELYFTGYEKASFLVEILNKKCEFDTLDKLKGLVEQILCLMSQLDPHSHSIVLREFIEVREKFFNKWIDSSEYKIEQLPLFFSLFNIIDREETLVYIKITLENKKLNKDSLYLIYFLLARKKITIDAVKYLLAPTLMVRD